MKRLIKEDLIKTIYRQEELRTILIASIVVLIFLMAMLRGEKVRAEAEVASLKSEIITITSDNVMVEEELKRFKEENLMLYKDYTKHCQLCHQSSMMYPVDMRLVFIDGDICYYDAYNDNALYYMDENGILNPIYNDDGTIRTFIKGE